MIRFTERVRFTVPSNVKAQWKEKAAASGLSLSAFLRDRVADLILDDELEVLSAQLEAQRLGAMQQ